MGPSVDFIVAGFKGEPLPKAPRTAADLGLGGRRGASGREAKSGMGRPKGATGAVSLGTLAM
jgi:hypothetical protein